MVYCPECSTRLEHLAISVYRCPKCGRWWVVHYDSEWGDIYTVTLVNPELMKTALAVAKMIKKGD